jgi:nucleotidyltransferase/DNA polymerase involved in DNA repair
MRIACIHFPAFPLQVEVRQRPDLVGKPVAVLAARPRPHVAFCSRAAHDAGVRFGMAPLAARGLVPDLIAIEPSEAQWREALVDLAGDLADLSPAVEAAVEDGWSILLEVPTGRRSAEVARALHGVAEAAGYRARIGIAGDRFTAQAAARFGGGPVTIVRRGQAAAFLAPLSIELLPLQPEVRAMLRAAGVRTLGEFAALPPPSVDRACAVDYRELARGNGPSELTPFRPLRARPRRRADDGRQLSLVSAAW